MLTAIFLVVGHCFFASLEGREEVLYMKRTLVQKLGLLVFGLMVCCFAAARDGKQILLYRIMAHNLIDGHAGSAVGISWAEQ